MHLADSFAFAILIVTNTIACGSKNILHPLRSEHIHTRYACLSSSSLAGVVKWYNNSLPSCGREFDSPHPHKNKNESRASVAIFVCAGGVRQLLGVRGESKSGGICSRLGRSRRLHAELGEEPPKDPWRFEVS